MAASDFDSRRLEVLVADDGSGPATAELVERFAGRASFDVRHVWQRDEGFRLSAVRNRAILQSRGEVLVFTDGDSLLHPHALQLHARRCRPSRAHTGERCYLGPEESARVLDRTDDVQASWARARARARPRLWRRYWQNAFHRLTGLKARPKLLGGNCAVHRLDLERVNGFDERFLGWGLEDDDLLRRLRRGRLRVRDGSLDCLVLHLFHPIHDSHAPSVHHTWNYSYFHRGGFLTRCRHGLRERSLEEISFLVAGVLPPELRELPGRLGRPRAGERAEVLLLAPGQELPRRGGGDCELKFRLGEEVLRDADPVGAALRSLGEKL